MMLTDLYKWAQPKDFTRFFIRFLFKDNIEQN